MDGERPAFPRLPIDRLVRAFSPTAIVLFGSYAKGCARPGSDLDVLVVADVAGDPAGHQRRARQLVAPSFPAVDVVLCTPEEAAAAATARSPFLLSILESGVTIYSR